MKNQNSMKPEGVLICLLIISNVYFYFKSRNQKTEDPHVKERNKFLTFMDRLAIDRKEATKQLEEYTHSQLVEANRQMEKYIKK
jgi:hypothetical protein